MVAPSAVPSQTFSSVSTLPQWPTVHLSRPVLHLFLFPVAETLESPRPLIRLHLFLSPLPVVGDLLPVSSKQAEP